MLKYESHSAITLKTEETWSF